MDKAACTFLPACTYNEHELLLSQHGHRDLHPPACLSILTMSKSFSSPSMDAATCIFLPAFTYQEHEFWLSQHGHSDLHLPACVYLP